MKTDKRGERNANARLTAEQVLLIRASGEPATVLADRLGVDFSTVYAVRRGTTWRHLLPARQRMRASDLIAHLETGGYIATGRGPDHVLLAHLEGGRLYRFGWCSALESSGDCLEALLKNPGRWVIIGQPTEDAARAELEKLGRRDDDGQWHWYDEVATEALS